MKNNAIPVEAFMQKCLAAKKNIMIPWTEKEGKNKLQWIKKLLKKNLIAQETFDKIAGDIKASTLDNQLYKDYHKCVKLLNKSGHGILVKANQGVEY